jgi:hypothetical protein
MGIKYFYNMKRLKPNYFLFRVAAVAVLTGTLSVVGLSTKDAMAQIWGEPSASPPDGNVTAPIWNQTTALQAGGLFLNGLGRFDTTGTFGNSYCANSKVCGADSGSLWGLVGEANNGYGVYASSVNSYGLYAATSNAASYAGRFDGNVYINTGSKLGIGVAPPAYPLDVNGNANATGYCISGANCITSWPTGGGGLWVANGNDIYNGNTGNVGIGTTNPGEKLEVNGRVTLAQTTAPATTTDKLYNVGGSLYWNGTALGAGGGSSQWQDGTGGIIYYNGGNVGIGTATPNNKLQVVGLINFESTSRNIFLGEFTGTANTTGTSNNALGKFALWSNTTGSFNSAFGDEALVSNTTGINNSAFGAQALDGNIDGAGNVAFGMYALRYNSAGNSNSALGYNALGASSTGNFNVAVGQFALGNNTTGGFNVAVGRNAGTNIPSATLSTLTYDTFIGYGATAQVDAITNSTAIGNGAMVTASNQVVIGNTSVTQTLLNGKVGIGTTSPGTTLQVNSTTTNDGIGMSNGTAWLKYMAGTTSSGAYNSMVSAGDNAIIYSNGTAGSGNLVIAPWRTGSGGIKMDGSGNVNIVGNITQGGVGVCLANGTNCPSGSGTRLTYTSLSTACSTSTTTGVLTGSAQAFTPTKTGKALVVITGMTRNSTVGAVNTIQIRPVSSAYGCGTGVSGQPTLGGAINFTSSTAAGREGFSITAITDTTAGQTRYFDLSLTPNSGTGYVADINASIVEL